MPPAPAKCRFHYRHGSPLIRSIYRLHPDIRHLDDRGMLIFNIQTQHGSYQVKIGAKYADHVCKEMHIPRHSRPIEITGEVHHLFLHGYHVSKQPLPQGNSPNLRGAIIMKHISLHFIDRHGQGDPHLPMVDSMIRPREKINLSGPHGEQMLQELQESGQLAQRIYTIIRNDIIAHIDKKR